MVLRPDFGNAGTSATWLMRMEDDRSEHASSCTADWEVGSWKVVVAMMLGRTPLTQYCND